MSRAYIAPLTLLLLLSCKADEGTGSATSTSDTDTSSGSSSATSDPTGAPVCVPGKSEACTCPGGAPGAQTCKPDGSGFDMCICDEQPTGSISGDASTSGPLPSTGDLSITTTDATTTDATTTDATTGTSSGSTTGPGGACQELLSIELTPADAELSGAWQLAMSMLGEGQIANLPNPMNASDGSVIYSPDIPCDATWYIWARIIDQGSNDSYFATLDGEPMPPAIFEGDCSNQGNGYKWARLNWRDPMAPSCMYVQDPWAPMWTAGVHAIEFTYRESPAIGRILVTNDPDLVPQ